jgi:hypothetical protein
MTTPDYSAELHAMGFVMETLSKLDRDAQQRVIQWVTKRLDIKFVEPAHHAPGRDPASVASGDSASSASVKARAGNINTVVSKIGANSSRTILIAAALHLTLYQGRDSFSRSELVALAKSAKIWKSDYNNQTSTQLGRLADSGTLVEKSTGIFYLADAATREYLVIIDA